MGLPRWSEEGDQLRIQIKAPYYNPSNRNGKGESPRPGASRIEKENVLACFESGTMRMARHHDPDAAALEAIECQRVKVMQHVDADTGDLNDSCCWNGVCPTAAIIVATDGIDRCDSVQIIEDAFISDIPGMNDQR
jgi:hypothetical protein